MKNKKPLLGVWIAYNFLAFVSIFILLVYSIITKSNIFSNAYKLGTIPSLIISIIIIFLSALVIYSYFFNRKLLFATSITELLFISLLNFILIFTVEIFHIIPAIIFMALAIFSLNNKEYFSKNKGINK